MTASQHDYKQWPFLDQEEFDLACAFFDQRYVRASMGPSRQIFKIRHRRALTTNTSFLEILRLLQLPDNDNGLSDIFGKMGGDLLSSKDVEMEEIEDGDQVDSTYCMKAKSIILTIVRKCYECYLRRMMELLLHIIHTPYNPMSLMKCIYIQLTEYQLCGLHFMICLWVRQPSTSKRYTAI